MTKGAFHFALLRETKQTCDCLISEIVASSRTCRSLVEESLLKLRQVDAVSIVGEEIHISPEQRLRVAELAIREGVDPERIARELRWQEFEAFADRVLRLNAFVTLKHFVFKSLGRRFEIDVIGAKEPLLLCIDCKHWHHGWAPSKVTRSARDQVERVLSLSQVLRAGDARLPTFEWHLIRVLPIVMTLADVSPRLIEGVPIVSALRFASFLSEINPCVDQLRFLDVRASQLTLPVHPRRGSTSSIPTLL